MAQPTWVTDSGSLGTIPEGKFYRASLEAFDPDFPSDPTKVKFQKIAGDLPSGVQIRSNGIIEGTPRAYVQGVPSPVAKNVITKFAVRVYTETIQNGVEVVEDINDRTFTLTITGQDEPVFVTPKGSLGVYYDGELVNYQIEFEDDDPGDVVEISLVAGELPPGVELTSTGKLYGYIEPADEVLETVGVDGTPWEAYPYQFDRGSVSKNYEFTLRITDGKSSNLRTFSIFVGTITADSTGFTADNTSITVDTISRSPFVNNYVEDLGRFKHNNFFIHQIEGEDPIDDIINYSVSGTLPGGLVLDAETGYIYGDLDEIGNNETTYNFDITVYKKEDMEVARTYSYKITIVGTLNESVEWITEANLGTIDNNSISLLNVEAQSDTGDLLYRLKAGEYNKLPQGLALQSNGDIVGKVAANLFRLIDYRDTADSSLTVDTTLTTADENGQDVITFDNDTTTFDRTCKFNAEAYNTEGTVSTTKEFTVMVNDKFDVPLIDVTVKALLTESDRIIIDELITNTDLFDSSVIYRNTDPYFGVATDVSFAHLYGLSPENPEIFAEGIVKHYNKELTLGELKTARALDSNGDVLYEVVYSAIQEEVESWENTVETIVGTVYPNSLDNMREELVHKVGQISNTLPLWQESKQEDGNVIGYIPAWVIAYTKPGESDTLLYNIKNTFTKKLNAIEFEVDRYILNLDAVRFWDNEDQRWLKYIYTTFDRSTTETTFDKDSLHFIEPKPYTADITTKTADTTEITADNGYKDYMIYTKTDKFDQFLSFPKKDIINSK